MVATPVAADTPRRLLRPATLAKAAVVVALLLLVGEQGADEVAAVDVSRVTLAWLPVMLACEVVSALALVAAQAALLGTANLLRAPGGEPTGPTLRILTRTTLVATALGYVVPGGPAVSSAYAARRYQRYGVSPAMAAQSQVATAAASGISLAGVALVGVLLPGAAARAGLDPGLRTVLLVVGGLMLAGSLGLALLIRSTRSRHWLATSRLVGWVTGAAPTGAAGDLPPRLALRRTFAATGCTVLSQLCDVGCLAAALVAAGVDVPWLVLPLAYGAAQLLGLLPLTPGGAGFLEGGLGALIVAPYAPTGAVALAVILYRAFSWGLWVLAGGIAVLRLRRR